MKPADMPDMPPVPDLGALRQQQQQEEGMQLDVNLLVATQNSVIAQARVKEVQMETAIQQLLAEKHQLEAELANMSAAFHALKGADDAEMGTVTPLDQD